MTPRPRLLFLIHSASRNGATILLLELIRWLKENSNYQIELLVNGRGELLDDFRALAPTKVWRNPAFFLEALPRRWKNALQPGFEAQCLKALLAGRSYDLVYANTAAVWPHVSVLARRAPALLWHIHELGYGLRLTMGEKRMRELFPIATRMVAVSQAVREVLTGEFGVPEQKVDLVHEFIPFPCLSPEESASCRRRIQQQLGWSEDSFVIGGCGSLGWRKGTDLFVQAAAGLSRQKGYERARFLWVGGGSEGDEALRFTHDVQNAGLSGRCSWVPTTDRVLDYYCAMDVFALPSREDPFPLVVLEAGARGLPAVCFARSGGGPEFVGEDAGLIARCLDVAEFTRHLMTLHDEPNLRQRLGAAASRKVKTLYSLEVQAPKLLQCIEACLASGGRAASPNTRIREY